MANRSSSITVSMLVDVNAKVDKAKTAIKSLEAMLESFNLGEGITKSLNSTFSKLDKEFVNFQALSNKELFNAKDLAQVEKSFDNIMDLINTLNVQTKNIKGIDIEKLIPADFLNKSKGIRQELKGFIKEWDAAQNELSKKQEGKRKEIDALEKQLNSQVQIRARAAEAEKKYQKAIERSGKADQDVTDIKDQINKKKEQLKLLEKESQFYQDGRAGKFKNKKDQSDQQRFEAMTSQSQSARTRNIKSIQQETDALEQQQKILEETAKLEKTNLTSARRKYSDAQGQLEDLLPEEEITKIQSRVQSLKQELSSLTINFDDSKIQKVRQELADLAGIKLSEIPSDLQELNTYLNSLNTDKITELQVRLGNLEAPIEDMKGSFEGMPEVFNEVASNIEIAEQASQDLDRIRYRFMEFFSVFSAVNLVNRAIRSAYQSVTELDKAMTETAVVTDFRVGDMWEKLPEYTKMANKLGTTTQGAYETSTLYYQQGLNTMQVMAISTETMKMARIAGMEYADATNMMTAALRGFNMEINEQSATRVNDVYSELAAITAADTNQIATAMTKTASIAASANMEFESTAAFLSQIIETTQEAPETAGTALKTIIARFTEVKKLYSQGDLLGTDEEGEAIDVNKIQAALRSVGISMTEFFRGEEGLDDVLLRLAEKWDTLDLTTQRYIATTAAGSRQQSRFLAMMSDYDRTMELVGAANDSAGASQEQFDKTLESLESKINNLTNAWQAFTMSLANDGLIKGVVDVLTGLLNAINGITDAFGEGSGIAKLLFGAGLFKVGGSLAGGLGSMFKAIQAGKTGIDLGNAFQVGAGKALGLGTIKLEGGNNLGKEIGRSIIKPWKQATWVPWNREQRKNTPLNEKQFDELYFQEQKEIIKKESELIDKKQKERNAARGQKRKDISDEIRGAQTRKNAAENTITAGRTTEDYSKAKAKALNKAAEIQAYNLQTGAQAAIALAGAAALIGKAFEKAGMEEAAEATNAIASGATVAATGLSIATAAAKLFGSAVAGGLGKASIIIGIITAVIGVADALIESAIERTQRLKEEADSASQQAESAKNAYEDLLSFKTQRNELLEELNKLVEGTERYRQKLEEINQLSENIIQTGNLQYGIDYTYTPEGGYKFAPGAEGKAAKNAKREADYTALASDYREWEVKEDSYTNIREFLDEGGLTTIERQASSLLNKAYNSGLTFDSFLEMYDFNRSHLAFDLYDEDRAEPILRQLDNFLEEKGYDISAWKTFENIINGETLDLGKQTLIDAAKKYSGKESGDYFQGIRNNIQEYDSSSLNAVREQIDAKVAEEGYDVNSFVYQALINATESQLEQIWRSTEPSQIENLLNEVYTEKGRDWIDNNGAVRTGSKEVAEMEEEVRRLGIDPTGKTNEQLYNILLGNAMDKKAEEDASAIIADYINYQPYENKLRGLKSEDFANATAKDDIEKDIKENIENQTKTYDEYFKNQSWADNIAALTMGEKLDLGSALVDWVGLGLSQTADQIGSILSAELTKEETSDFANALLELSPQSYLQALKGIRDLAVDFQGEASKIIFETAATEIPLKGLFKELYDSSSFSKGLATLTEIYETTGNITAQDVQDLVKDYDDLSLVLEASALNAEGLASALELVESGDVSFENMTGSLLAALSIAGDFESRMASAFSYIDGFEPERSAKDIGDFAKDKASTIMDLFDAGLYQDAQLQQYWTTLFGGESYQNLIKAIADTSDLPVNQAVDEIMKAVGAEVTALQQVEKTGNFSGFWQMYAGKLEGTGITIDKDGRVQFGEQIGSISDAEAILQGIGISPSMANLMVADAINRSTGDTPQRWRKEAAEEGLQALIAKENAATSLTMEEAEAYYNKYGATLGYTSFDEFRQKKLSGYELASISKKNEIGAVAHFQERIENGLYDKLDMSDADLFGIENLSFNIEDTIKKLEQLGYTSKESFEIIKQNAKGTAMYMSEDLSKKVQEMFGVEDFAKASSEEIQQAMSQIATEQQGQIMGQAMMKGMLESEIGEIQVPIQLTGIQEQITNLKGTATITVSKIVGWPFVKKATGQRGWESSRIPGFFGGRNNYEGLAWTGEEGPELINGQHGTYIAGLNGPELQYIYSDDAIYTADQTRRIFNDLNVPGFGGGKPGWSYDSRLPSMRDWKSGTGSGGNKKIGGDWDNPYDELYNLTERINEALRDREKLERQYDRLLENRNASYTDLIRNTLDSMANLRKEIALQQALQAGRARQLENIGQYTYRDKDKKEKTFAESDVMQYAQYDSTTGLLEIDWEGIEAVTDENKGAAIEAYISKLEELVEQYEETEETIADMEDTLEEIRDRGKEQYLEFEDRIYEALVEREQKLIDEYEDVSNTINDSNSRILDGLRESIDLSRQIRDNTQTEEDIADKEARLAYLRRDTSGANQLEIQQLEEELKEMRESYSDSLVDQELDRLNQVNETANEQRERQIEIANAQLEWLEQSGYFWDETYALLKGAFNEDGTLNNNSALVNLLKETDGFKGMSEFGSYDWIVKLIQEFNEAENGFSSWMLDKAEDQGYIERTSVGKLTYDRESGKWTGDNGKEYTTVWNEKKNDWDVKEVKTDTSTEPSYNHTTTTTTTTPTITESKSKSKGKEPYTIRTTYYKVEAGSGKIVGYQSDSTYYTSSKKEAQELASESTQISWASAWQRSNLAKKIKTGMTGVLYEYATGGLNTHTGPAILDGTPSRPEYVLNAEQTGAFLQLADVLPALMSNNSISTSTSSGDNYFDININVDSISSDYDVDRLTERIKQNIYEDGAYRNVNVINRLR